MRTLLIDNYDSFTFNLFQLIWEVSGQEPIVVKNDERSWAKLKALDISSIVVSPGPGTPERHEDLGVSREALVNAEVPLLGVCLGHQGIGAVCGREITHAPEPMHGRTSSILHTGNGLFRDIPSPFTAVRYHSLMIPRPLPDCLEEIAWTSDGVVMGVRHRNRPLWGVQFHPESICSEYGRQLLANFFGLRRAEIRPRSVSPVASAVSAGAPLFELQSRLVASWSEPESVFGGAFAHCEEAFWLDSSVAEAGRARFSFMGTADGPLSERVSYRVGENLVRISKGGSSSTVPGSIFDYLGRELERRRLPRHGLPFDFNCGYVGYFGYELKAHCGGEAVHAASNPDAQFIFADRLVAFDHLQRRVYLLALTEPGKGAECQGWFDAMEAMLLEQGGGETGVSDRAGSGAAADAFSLARPEADYLADIDECLRLIRDGETYEVCLTNQFQAPLRVAALEVYRALRQLNPAPYAAYLKFGQLAVASSSPERFLKIGSDRWVESKPIKGTARRDPDAEKDRGLAEALRSNEKDRAENLMIVDLVRNDLGSVCEVGSVQVPSMMKIESFATVHQLVSTIRGRIRSDFSTMDCIRAAFPPGSMTGAPKVRTMKIIDALEPAARGVYSGSIGYLSLCGAADLNVVIRTAVVLPDSVAIGAGGAIVALSDRQAEFDEIVLKGAAPRRAVAIAAAS